MTEPKSAPWPPRPPKGTGPAGKRLWSSVVNSFELDGHELTLLVEAVRCLDALDRLEAVVRAEGDVIVDRFDQPRAHPAAIEARQLRVVYAKMLAALRVPDGVAGDESAGRRKQRSVGVRGPQSVGQPTPDKRNRSAS